MLRGQSYFYRFSIEVLKNGQGMSLKFHRYHLKKLSSFWHDPELFTADSFQFNIIVEIPRYTLAKYEMSTTELGNPIVHDTRISRFTGLTELRYYAQFPYFSYGYFPRTWESPLHQEQGYFGDNDALDAVELGEKEFTIGQQVQVRVLGALCVLDQGEIDWKILCLNVDEARQLNVSSINDVEKLKPGYLSTIKNWFKTIKTFDGKKPNVILYNEKVHDVDESIAVIQQNHQLWKELCSPNDLQYEKYRKEFKIIT